MYLMIDTQFLEDYGYRYKYKGGNTYVFIGHENEGDLMVASNLWLVANTVNARNQNLGYVELVVSMEVKEGEYLQSVEQDHFAPKVVDLSEFKVR